MPIRWSAERITKYGMRSAIGGRTRTERSTKSSVFLKGKRKRPNAYPPMTAMAVPITATEIATTALLKNPRATAAACPPKTLLMLAPPRIAA